MKVKNGKQWTKAFFLSLGLVLLFRYFLLVPLHVSGDSMSPSLKEGDYIAYGPYASVERFDTLLFHDHQGQRYLKRVIGLPGESLAYLNDQLYIDGKPVEEPYLEENRVTNQVLTPDFTLSSVTGDETIPEGHYFMMGDNRARSKDSRMFGLVPKEAIEGKAHLIIYPLKSISFLPIN